MPRRKAPSIYAVIVLLIVSIAWNLPDWFGPSGPVSSPRAGEYALDRVIDGDTIRIWYQGQSESVRLLRINTPERGRPGYGEATESLRELIGGRSVALEFENGEIERDRYDRLLAYVFADGVNANVEQVRRGWSDFWTRYGEGKYAAQFREAEEQAKREKAGMWTSGGF